MKDNKVFSEVYSVLVALGPEYICCIPDEVIEIIIKSRDESYTIEIDKNKPLDEQNISNDAINIIAKLHMDYWCDSEKERKELYQLLENNEKKANEQLLKNMFN